MYTGKTITDLEALVDRFIPTNRIVPTTVVLAEEHLQALLGAMNDDMMVDAIREFDPGFLSSDSCFMQGFEPESERDRR